jgi:4-amino-4-deoxy-L-arabinose transferase-like glycosyltransferase
LLIAAVAEQRGMTFGLLAGMVLLTTPIYLEQSAMQTADVPLAFYFLATVVLLTAVERAGRPQPLFLAGVTTGLASWTKNEGLLFLIAALAVSLTLTMKQRSFRPSVKQALVLVSGAAPALLIGLWFRETVAPPNDLMNQQVVHMLAKLADPTRYARILLATLSEVWRHYPWLPVLGAGVLVCGYDRQLLRRAPLTILGTVMAGYFAIYLITPLDLGYHLGSSLERLLLQLWPIGLFVFFSGVREPGYQSSR